MESAVHKPEAGRAWRYHCLLAGFALLLLASYVGCRMTGLRVLGLVSDLGAVSLATAMYAPLPAFWQQRDNARRRNAVLVLPLVLLFSNLCPLVFLLGARLRRPLVDAALMSFDARMGIHVDLIQHWAATHALGHACNFFYDVLPYYLLGGLLAAAVLGWREARIFLAANLLAISLAAPLFAWWPAVGPWRAEKVQPNLAMRVAETGLTQLRAPGDETYSYAANRAAIVSFPSFHTIWAVIAAATLWRLRRLRGLLVALSAAIVLSTLTTGWHYFADVVAGLGVAAAALLLAHRLVPEDAEPERA